LHRGETGGGWVSLLHLESVSEGRDHTTSIAVRKRENGFCAPLLIRKRGLAKFFYFRDISHIFPRIKNLGTDCAILCTRFEGNGKTTPRPTISNLKRKGSATVSSRKRRERPEPFRHRRFCWGKGPFSGLNPNTFSRSGGEGDGESAWGPETSGKRKRSHSTLGAIKEKHSQLSRNGRRLARLSVPVRRQGRKQRFVPTLKSPWDRETNSGPAAQSLERGTRSVVGW